MRDEGVYLQVRSYVGGVGGAVRHSQAKSQSAKSSNNFIQFNGGSTEGNGGSTFSESWCLIHNIHNYPGSGGGGGLNLALILHKL